MSYIYSKKVPINGHVLWKHWTDVANWHRWREDMKNSKLVTTFEISNSIMFTLKKCGTVVTLTIVDISIENTILSFSDCTSLPLTKMYGTHKIIIINEEESILETTIETTGFLQFFWNLLFINSIKKNVSHHTDAFIRYVTTIENLDNKNR